jgi:hypothetical protein
MRFSHEVSKVANANSSDPTYLVNVLLKYRKSDPPNPVASEIASGRILLPVIRRAPSAQSPARGEILGLRRAVRLPRSRPVSSFRFRVALALANSCMNSCLA